MMLKQHRKATLELRGRGHGRGQHGGPKLVGNLNVSLTNAGDRNVLREFIVELNKQWRNALPVGSEVPDLI